MGNGNQDRRFNILSDLESVHYTLDYEVERTDDVANINLPDEFWDDAEAFLDKWFERVLDRDRNF